MAFIKSLLTESIKALPDAAIKAESVVPTLLKKGVKQEELNFAKMALPTKGKVTKEQLVEAEAKRKDKFYTTTTNDHQVISLAAGRNNPTYKMKVLSFNEQGAAKAGEQEIAEEAPSRYTSSHTTVPDYLAHTRIYDEEWDGRPVRVLQEIQSDLHQQGRQEGYTNDVTGSKEEVAALLKRFEDADDFWAGSGQSKFDTDEAATAEMEAVHLELEELGIKLPEGDSPGEHTVDSLMAAGNSEGVPKSPQEKQWLRKGIERELVDAIEEGRTELVIPISGKAVAQLARAQGVQKWYETQVVNTAKKVAKASGSSFEMVEKDGITFASIKPTGTFVETKPGVAPLHKSLAEIKEQHLEGLTSGTVSKEQVVSELAAEGYDAGAADTLVTQMMKEATDSSYTGHMAAISRRGQVVEGKLELDKKFSFSLYSSPGSAAAVAYIAYQQGASEEQVSEALGAKGFELDEVSSQLDFIKQAVEQGATVKDAVKYLEAKDVKAKTIEKKPPAYDPTQYTAGRGAKPYVLRSGQIQVDKFKDLMDEQNKMDDQEVLAALMTIYPVMSSTVMTDVPAMVGREDASQRYDMARSASRYRIQTMFEERTGKVLYWDRKGSSLTEKFYIKDEAGEDIEITPGILDGLYASKYEIGLSAVAGIVGGRFAGGKGAYSGTLAGAVAGAEADYLSAATRLQLDMDAEGQAWKMLNAGEMAVVGEAVAYPILKSMGYAWRSIAEAITTFKIGDSGGAAKALKEATFLNQDEVEEITRQVGRFAQLDGTASEQGIQAVVMTQPGMEHVVSAAGRYGEVGTQLTESIKRRTKNILAATNELTDEQVPRMLGGDLQDYVADVKQSYNAVKIRATEAPNADNFAYDFDKLAIQPILDDTADKIFDPAVRDRFINQMNRVRSLTEQQGLGNLVELRQLVNDFLYNSNITKVDDKKLIRGAITEIDGAIEAGAHAVLPAPQQWIDDWASVRSEYSEMKKVEESAIYKSIMTPQGQMRAISPDQVVKRLTKYITALDGSFERVISQLPMEGRKLYEGAIVDSLTNKYAINEKAIHFPKLAEDLAKVSLTTPDARAMKKLLMDLGETFKNDVKIVNASTGMHIPSIAQGLSDNLLVKAKYELASNTYQKVRSFLSPTARHRTDLLKKVNSLIEEPLNLKATKELLEVADGDVNIAEHIRVLQQEAASAKAAGEDAVTPKLHFYGTGSVLRLKGTGPVTAKIPAHRIVNLQKAKVIAESENLTLDSKQLDEVLKRHGYQAIMNGSESIRKLK